MKAWKVILAAVVIFAAGVVTGGLTAGLKFKQVPAPTTSTVPLASFRQRGEVLDRMQRQLYLTPDQRERIEQVLRESNGRMKQLWETIAPQAQEERRRVNDLIRAELTPEQRAKFEEMLKSRAHNRSFEERRRRDQKSARKTNAPASLAPAAK